MELTHKTNPYATHQPVLIAALENCIEGKPVLELGSGEGSTELLHKICQKQNRWLWTIDHDQEWLSRYWDAFNGGFHIYKRLDFEEILLDHELIIQDWGLVFCDQGDWDSRAKCMEFFRDKADFLVLHDSDIYRDTIYKKFKYGKEIISDFGPPTFLASNRRPVDFEINMKMEKWK